MRKKFRYFVGDFETVVLENTAEQESTEVWASALVELGTEDVTVLHSIEETFSVLYKLSKSGNLIVYYHNLKFDGSFWLDYLINHTNFKQAFDADGTRIKPQDMEVNTFHYIISDMGQWYNITIKTGKHTIELRDSLKLLPFSVKQIGKSFKTKHQKLDMEYKGNRYAGCYITPKEIEYIKNDVLVVKEALEIMFSQGHDKMTIGSCCMKEFKKQYNKDTYNDNFPDLFEIPLDNRMIYEQKEKGYREFQTIGDYIRASYRGGWCYLVKGKENRIFHNGTTADVNSLYPSMMHSQSGNRYPIGYPLIEWYGDIPEHVKNDKTLFWFVRFRTRFKLKDGYLPFIQVKHSICYRGTDCLETSDIYSNKTGKYYSCYREPDGTIKPATVEFVMTMMDYELFHKHYRLYDTEMIGGIAFASKTGIFDDYINHYKKIKMNSTGAIRSISKLFLNSLYGKFAASTDSSHKIAIPFDYRIGFYSVEEHKKQAGYIPIGSAITSYSRCFTITAAQKNYHGVDKAGFIYADTDSIHCDLAPEDIKGIRVSDNDFCAWKLESCWDTGLFVRQKTYLEHITKENLKDIEKPYYNIKCAGMPDRSKEIFIEKLKSGELQLSDFNYGLVLAGKLMPKRIKGGIVLVDTEYTMRRYY